jgi:branched-chain amino acid transport system ATP-binding protein
MSGESASAPADERDGLHLRALRVERDGRLLLDVASLHAPPGHCTVVVGPADAGKTLLAGVAAGSVDGARGTVRLGGRLLSGAPSARQRAGLAAVPSQPLRLRGITVAEALSLARASHRGVARRVSDAFDRFSLLAARRSLLCERLSGGEHQVLRIACAWVCAPLALVLDSPTTGLAAPIAKSVVELAREEAARGVAVLWLDQPGAPAPAPPALRIDSGRLSALEESRTASPTGWDGSAHH